MSVSEIFKSMEYGPAPESPSAVYAWLDEHKRRLLIQAGAHIIVPDFSECNQLIAYLWAVGHV